MMHFKALVVKFIMMTAVLWLVLGGLFGISFGTIFTISVFLTGLAYIIGDLLVLPRFGNGIATIADFGLSLAGVWLLGSLLITRPVALGLPALISAVVTAVGEAFFHRYMENQILPEAGSQGALSEKNLQTEFGEELNASKGERRKKGPKRQ